MWLTRWNHPAKCVPYLYPANIKDTISKARESIFKSNSEDATQLINNQLDKISTGIREFPAFVATFYELWELRALTAYLNGDLKAASDDLQYLVEKQLQMETLYVNSRTEDKDTHEDATFVLNEHIMAQSHDLGKFQLYQGLYEDAQRNFQLSARRGHIYRNLQHVGRVSGLMGAMYDAVGNPKVAEAYHKEALKLNPFVGLYTLTCFNSP